MKPVSTQPDQAARNYQSRTVPGAPSDPSRTVPGAVSTAGLDGPPASRSRGRRGFTLLEVLFTIIIFGIGLIAIASIFPVAGRMQKNTLDDIVAHQVKRNAQTLMKVRGLSNTDLIAPSVLADAADPADPDIQVIPPEILGNPLADQPFPAANARWTPDARSYPSSKPFDIDTSGNIIANEREFFWVPLIRKVGPGTTDWQTFVFVLHRKNNTNYADTTYPQRDDKDPSGEYWWANAEGDNSLPGALKIRLNNADIVPPSRIDFDNDYFGGNDGLPDQILAGDWVLTSNGVIYSVVTADAQGITVDGYLDDPTTSTPPINAIWYSPPPAPGEPSPLMGIIPVSNAVKP